MRWLRERRLGTDATQGGHQVPQKSRSRTFPRRSSAVRYSPASVVSSKSGTIRFLARTGLVMSFLATSASCSPGPFARYSLRTATPSVSRDIRSRVTPRLKRMALIFPPLISRAWRKAFSAGSSCFGSFAASPTRATPRSLAAPMRIVLLVVIPWIVSMFFRASL